MKIQTTFDQKPVMVTTLNVEDVTEREMLEYLAEIPKAEQRELKLSYAKGEQPPQGYLANHDWARSQLLHGLRQKQCGCRLWLFPQEIKVHKCKHTAARQ